MSAAYNIGAFSPPLRVFVPKTRARAKLPGIGSGDSTTKDHASATQAWTRKSQANTEAKKKNKGQKKKKKCLKKKKAFSSQEPGVVHKKIQKVDGSRYMSIDGYLKLGDREVRVVIQDATSGSLYKTVFQLDEDSARMALADAEEAGSMVRAVAMACRLVPNRHPGSGLVAKGQPWRASMDPAQLKAVLRARREMEEEERQEKPTRRHSVGHAPTHKAATGGEFDYFDETLSCPPPTRKKKRQPRKKRLARPPIPSAKNLAMRAPRFLPQHSDILFQCTRVLDDREIDILAAYRPHNGTITLQARDAAIDHCWRLVLRSRAPGQTAADDGGFVKLPFEQQMASLEDLAGNLRIVNSSAHSLGTLELSRFQE